ncbi:MAG: hypothetical protein CMF52_03200 [Legionellales bacterium]|nr:hypothetical protein [Legionellales bacterium]|tara:strand:+ start:232 stop:1143 length:912 start_codon:yes stop_codon:yes gene_type:complete
MDKNFYNEASAKKLGWEPSWFGEKYFDDKLTRAIKKWQRSRSISADGLCGPMTFRRLWTERQERKIVGDYCINNGNSYSNSIVYNGEFFPIEWQKFLLWSDDGGISAKPGHFYDYSTRPRRNIRYFVNHWDVCLNSRSCQEVLDKRGISVHFLIDNDGTIYQTLDLQHAAWHAGSARTNRASAGVEISNAYYPKYQAWYVANNFGERPIISDAWAHGNKLEPFMGFYPVQIEALKALWKAIHLATGIPYETPLNQFGKTSTKYVQDVPYGKFEGFVSHYHVSKNKIDCAALDIHELLQDLKDS